MAEHGITSLELLLKQDVLRIEAVWHSLLCKLYILNFPCQLLNRRPPFGLEVLTSARELPHYSLTISELSVTSNGGGKAPVEVDLLIECRLAEDSSYASRSRRHKGHASDMTAVLTLTSDMEFLDFRRIPYVADSTEDLY